MAMAAGSCAGSNNNFSIIRDRVLQPAGGKMPYSRAGHGSLRRRRREPPPAVAAFCILYIVNDFMMWKFEYTLLKILLMLHIILSDV